MPWLLQPKSYTQIARPNLYNVAYRRVGTYKGMGRLHPTNYLQIGYRPNMIGATTGQYNTLSGQLSLLPPSLRGLGQGAMCPSTQQLMGNYDPLDPCQNLPTGSSPLAAQFGTAAGTLMLQPGGANLVPYLMPGGATLPPGGTATGSIPQPTTNYLPWIIGGALLLVLLGAPRR